MRSVQGEFRKQISLFVSLDDWRLLRAEAARRKVPVTELCRPWLDAGLQKLRRRPAADQQAESA